MLKHIRIAIKLLFGAITFAIFMPANAISQTTYIQNVNDGDVCFPDGSCVKVGAAWGALREGPNPRPKWFTEIRDASGKVTTKVRLGGEILVLSPHAIAKREAGQATFSIERIDRTTRPIRTNFTRIELVMHHILANTWRGPGNGAFGIVGTPPPSSVGARDAWSSVGNIGGISPAGELLGSVDDSLVVFQYDDYWVILHSNGLDFTITDNRFRILASRIKNLKAFFAPYDEYGFWKEGTDGRPVVNHARSQVTDPNNRKVVFAYETGKTGAGNPLFQVLPRKAGSINPPDLIGLFPLSQDFSPRCNDSVRKACVSGVPGWGAIWSTPDGPQISIANIFGTQFDTRRYKSLRWKSVGLYRGGIGEELNGGFRYITTHIDNYGDITFSHSLEKYNNASQVENLITAEGNDQRARVLAALEAVRAKERERNAAFQAQRAAEERERQARAATEASEFSKAQALLAGNDTNAICAGIFTINSLHGRNNLSEACTRLRGGPQIVSRGFWGDLSAGLAAYNAGQFGPVVVGSSPTSVSTNSSSNAGDFNRSMQTLDRNLSAIANPNWNGAAAAAQRY